MESFLGGIPGGILLRPRQRPNPPSTMFLRRSKMPPGIPPAVPIIQKGYVTERDLLMDGDFFIMNLLMKGEVQWVNIQILEAIQ